MKDPILKSLKKLNKKEKEDLFFFFISSKEHDFIQIKGKNFKVNEFEMLKTFIEIGVNVNTRDGFDFTPLFHVKSKEIA